MMSFLNNDKGFFQGGKSFGGRGFLEPLLANLAQGFPQQANDSPEGIDANPESGEWYKNVMAPQLQASGGQLIFQSPYKKMQGGLLR